MTATLGWSSTVVVLVAAVALWALKYSLHWTNLCRCYSLWLYRQYTNISVSVPVPRRISSLSSAFCVGIRPTSPGDQLHDLESSWDVDLQYRRRQKTWPHDAYDREAHSCSCGQQLGGVGRGSTWAGLFLGLIEIVVNLTYRVCLLRNQVFTVNLPQIVGDQTMLCNGLVAEKNSIEPGWNIALFTSCGNKKKVGNQWADKKKKRYCKKLGLLDLVDTSCQE
jgi:hypothetical protein